MSSCEPEDPAHRNLQTWIRIIQILCNLILGLVGKGGVSLGTLTKVGYFKELELFDHYETLNVNVFLASSVILTVISWIGVFAGTKNCRKSSLTNGLLLGGFVIVTTAYVATKGITTHYTKTSHLYDRMKKEMHDYDKHPHFINTLQNTLLCCGLDGIKTWNKSHIPESCCRHSPIDKLECTLDSPNLHSNGCFEEFIRTGRYYAWLIYSILASSGLLEIFGIILSQLQCRIIDDRNEKKLAKESPPKIPRPIVSIFETQHEEKEKVQEEKKKEKVQEEDKKETVQEEKEAESNTCRIICKDFPSARNILTLHFH